MQWKAEDIEVYLQEKEYIDTVVIPLIPLAFGPDIKQTVEKGEFAHLLSLQLERQFKGRMLFIPNFTYLMGDEEASLRLQEWERKLRDSGFTYVFFLTSDPAWREVKEIDPKTLLFVPSVPLEHMDNQYKQSIMEDQVKQLMKEIVKGWQ
ncbi:YpiF family protein [Siminovitchia sediminis]|uniref:YpiF family protein n=1 Tax=Siminovitchia sediminis TaxID=1274353 RepID=A0ABW4KLQ9_9BACI